MFGGLFYFDPWYFLLIVPAMIIGLIAQAKVKSTFNKYSGVLSQKNVTGAQVAREILDANGLSSIKIERVNGSLTDHFDPRTGVIRLSDIVYSSTSVASIGVAAHEVGHAIQYAENYSPIKLRNAIIPVTNFGAKFSFVFILLGLLFSQTYWLIWVGIALYSLTAVFQLVTLPVEFNASTRALKILENNLILDKDELNGTKKVLSAAAMTYVAALVASLAQILRLILIFGNRRGND